MYRYNKINGFIKRFICSRTSGSKKKNSWKARNLSFLEAKTVSERGDAFTLSVSSRAPRRQNENPRDRITHRFTSTLGSSRHLAAGLVGQGPVLFSESRTKEKEQTRSLRGNNRDPFFLLRGLVFACQKWLDPQAAAARDGDVAPSSLSILRDRARIRSEGIRPRRIRCACVLFSRTITRSLEHNLGRFFFFFRPSRTNTKFSSFV